MARFSISSYVKAIIEHRKIVYLATVALCVLGLVGLDHINKDEFPTFEIKQGLVVGVYPGASSEEVETKLAKPLEEMLATIPEVSRASLESVSQDGLCYIYVDLTCSQKLKTQVWGKIKDKLAQGKIFLPPGVLTIQVLDDFSDVSSILLALQSEDKGWSEMQEYAERLQERLRSIDRLASVSIIGRQQEEIAIKIDMARLSTYGISPSSLFLVYSSAMFDLPAGNFHPDYISAPIIVDASVTDEAEIAQRVVWCDAAGHVVRLKDIASIERRVKEPDSEVHFNGNSALILNLVMRPDNNIVSFGKDVDKVLEEFSGTLPSSVTVSRVSDQPKVVDKSVMGFLRDLLISMLVVIFVMIMMFPMRSAVIASSGVPVCTLITIAVMYMTGMCLNTVTLAALIVVLGMIVDDSIITMDGYMDKLSHGMSKIDAAAKSAKELFMPMFMATLSICAMFFPMLGIIDGYLGDFIKSFPWIILIALMTSLVYAVSVVPGLETRFIDSVAGNPSSPIDSGVAGAAVATARPGLIARMQQGLFSALQHGYDKVQAQAFRHPWITLGTGFVTIALGILMFCNINVQMMPYAARKSFAVEIYLEPGNDLNDTKQVVDSLEKMLLKDGRITDITSFIGTGAPRYHCTYTPKTPAPTFAQMIVNTESEIATEEILPWAEARYEHYFPNALIHVKQMDYQGTDAPVSVLVMGDDREKFFWVADSIATYMRGMNNSLKWVHESGRDFTSRVNLEMDPQEAARFGTDKTLLSLSLAKSFSGSRLFSLSEKDGEVPVNIYDAECYDTAGYGVISSLLVPSYIPGVKVPVGQIASVAPRWEISNLTRHGMRECVSVSADMKYGHSHPVVMKPLKSYIDGLQKRHPFPEGTEIKYAGLSATNGVIGPQIAWSFIAAIAIMFFFLFLHFKKVSLTVLSLSLSLLCLFGASFGLWAFNLDFGMTSVLGIVSLIGIIVRNGIIMFEYAEELHFEQGHSVKEAAMLAGQRRMRPIFLTSCTTALGVLPMIISGDALWQPMGLVICSGIIFSILLIVFIMPVSYWKIFEKSRSVKRV